MAKARRARSEAKTSGKRAAARGKVGRSATSRVAARTPAAKKRSSKTAAGKKSSPKRRSAKKAATPRSAAKKLSARMSATKKKTAKKAPARKAAAKKATVKKATAKKRAAKKIVAKRATVKKATAKKRAAKKTLVKKAPAKKQVKKTTTTRKAATKRAASKSAVAKKAVAKKAVAKKAVAKKAVAKKAVAKKAVAKKAVAKKAVAKKAVAKKVGAKKRTAIKTPAKKTVAKTPLAKKAAAQKTGARKTAAKPASPRKAAAPKAAAAARRSPPPPVSSKAPKVELAPRSSVVAPSIPIPVKKVPRRPTLEERAKRARRRIAQQSAQFRSRYDDNFAMSWIYHDSALEGVVYTFEELTAAFCNDEVTVVDSSVMPIYDAIRRHRSAISYVRKAAEKKRAVVGVDFLKELYVILHPENGDTKSVKYRRDTPQHRLYFHEYAAPDKIAYRVRQVIEWVNSPRAKKSAGALRTAARAHYDLARTYPFQRDSGKVARLFMNFLLMRGGLPPAIVHATERQRYYEALKATSAASLVRMLRDSVANALSSIEKLLDEHENRTRRFPV